jgi:hypothetical protein
MAHDRGCEITEIQPHMVTIEQKERNSILLVQHFWSSVVRTRGGCREHGCLIPRRGSIPVE